MITPTHGRRLSREADAQMLAAVVDAEVDLADYPNASEVVNGALVYDAQGWQGVEGAHRWELRAEIVRALADGPGVILLRGAFADTSVIDAATEQFLAIIEEERAAGGEAGDHFGQPGANSRIWNAQQKLALRAPEVFAAYFANDPIALASQAWLGPGYQMTSQVNLVHPGGRAQEPHCDYHLGFMEDAHAEQFPAHVHELSATLTLQGAVAHCDMPVESGPTMLLPHSQKFPWGYVAWRRDDVKALFAERMVQVPLAKGDAVFFSPALIHGAGTNRSTDIQRMANLLQVSSAFGRAMESLDRLAMTQAVYPVLLEHAGEWPQWAIDNVIASCAEGYAFPTNLDHDQPVGGLAPASQADLVRSALADGLSADAVGSVLQSAEGRRSAS